MRAALEAQDRKTTRHGRGNQLTKLSRSRAIIEKAIAHKMQEILKFIIRQPNGLGKQWIDTCKHRFDRP